MAKRKNPAAVALGRLGGKKTSTRKTEAARKNARRPRPGRRRPMVEELERLSPDLDRVVSAALARLRKRTA